MATPKKKPIAALAPEDVDAIAALAEPKKTPDVLNVKVAAKKPVPKPKAGGVVAEPAEAVVHAGEVVVPVESFDAERVIRDVQKGWPRVMVALAEVLPWPEVGPTLNEWKLSRFGPSEALAAVREGKTNPRAV